MLRWDGLTCGPASAGVRRCTRSDFRREQAREPLGDADILGRYDRVGVRLPARAVGAALDLAETALSRRGSGQIVARTAPARTAHDPTRSPCSPSHQSAGRATFDAAVHDEYNENVGQTLHLACLRLTSSHGPYGDDVAWMCVEIAAVPAARDRGAYSGQPPTSMRLVDRALSWLNPRRSRA